MLAGDQVVVRQATDRAAVMPLDTGRVADTVRRGDMVPPEDMDRRAVMDRQVVTHST